MKNLSIKRYKINKKVLLTLTITFIVTLVTLVPFSTHANAFTDIMWGMLGGIIRLFADGIVTLCEAVGGNFDKLIFNSSNGNLVGDLNITLLRQTTLSSQIFAIYKAMQIVAAAILAAISAYIAVDFAKAGDNPQHKAVLLSRLKRLVLSFFLITSLPVLIDIMIAINYAITDMFRLLTIDFVGGSMDFTKPFLMETFREMATTAKGADEVIYSLMYLIAGFINIWLIVFYMLRDLGISFLLIVAPLMASILPYKTDLILSWAKEMASNIFTQSIQALILCVVMAISSGVANGNLYDQIFCLVAFITFIPMTGMLKRMIGLEGTVGAAASNAGLGGTVMAIGLAGRMARGGANSVSQFRETGDRIRTLKAERDNPDKVTASSMNLPNTNSNTAIRGVSSGGVNDSVMASAMHTGVANDLSMGRALSSLNNDMGGKRSSMSSATRGSRDRNTINGEINALRKARVKSTVGGLGSAIGGISMAIGASGLGNMGTFVGASMGSTLGEGIGDSIGGIAYDTGSFASEGSQDMLYGRGIRPDKVAITNGNRSWRPGNVRHNLANMKSNLKSNMDSVKADLNDGFGGTVGDMLTSKDTSEVRAENRQVKQDNITGLTGDPLKYSNGDEYNQEMNARLYSQKLTRQGNFNKAYRARLRHSVSPLNTEALNLEQSTALNNGGNSDAMLYSDANTSILFKQNAETGEREVLGQFEGNPNLSSPRVEGVSFSMEKEIPISDNLNHDFSEIATRNTEARFGADNINSPEASKYMQSQLNTMMDQHISRVQSFRQASGMQHAVINEGQTYERMEFNIPTPNISLINPPEGITSQQRNIAESINLSKLENSTPAIKEQQVQARESQYTMVNNYRQSLESARNDMEDSFADMYTNATQLN